jgi:prepilin peptidase CpaA
LTLPAAVVLIAALIATVTDLTRFKIYNALTLPLLVSGIAYHAIWGEPIDVVGSVVGMLLGAGILFIFYVMGGMGAGDVKLMAAFGAWLGLPYIFYVFVASALAAGVYSLVLMIVFGSGREMWINLQVLWQRLAAVGRHLGGEDRIEREVQRDDRRRRLIPFAAMMAVGVIALLLFTWLAERP